ncbi:MAG: tRNA dihydrouridine synthase DusB [Planctomycetes bacterium]|nr:tRNA dihydrouridine synthase DusB [Planctomycetota bacterium]
MRSELNCAVPLARAGEFSPLRIGALRVDPPVVLAPMAGVTNPPFRRICRAYGAGLYVSEMISARALLHGNPATRRLAAFASDEAPRSAQLYATDPEAAAYAVAWQIEENGAHHVDLNFGCPVRKVTAAGGGSAIPLKPRLLARIVGAAVRAAQGRVPVTIKVRKGVDEHLLTYLDAGRVAESEGAAAIGLHARTAAQLYAGEADWSAIAALKAAVSIPVLGNGDIWEAFDALRMMRETGCDGVIVGRGCLGRPWLFRELAQAFAGSEPEAPPRLGEIAALALHHGKLLEEFMGTHHALLHLRKWAAWYTKGFPGTAALRERLNAAASWSDYEAALSAVDPEAEFPASGLRMRRGKGSSCQVVSLPPGFLENRDDDQPYARAGASCDEADDAAIQGG